MEMTTRVMVQILDGRPPDFPRPTVFVETGTLFGQTTAIGSALFVWVYTIELSASLREDAKRRWPKLLNVDWLRGDSRKVLPPLTRLIDKNVLWYLDAHWYPRSGVEGQGQLPLWEELEAIRRRDRSDIIVVDDVHSFGTSDPEPSWRDVTADRIVKALGRQRHGLDERFTKDQFVYYKWRVPPIRS